MKPEMEHDLYLRVVDMTAESAKAFIGRNDDPVDLGPADSSRYREGARIWGFLSRKETANERAARIWRPR